MLALLFSGGGISLAQEATATATPSNVLPAHPAAIQRGACDTLGEVAFPRTAVSAPDMTVKGTSGTPETASSPGAGSNAMSAADPGLVETSDTRIAEPLDQIVSDGYAITILASPASKDSSDRVIACGEIGGMVIPGPGPGEGDRLLVGLREQNSSGSFGVAILENASGGTEVTIYLTAGSAQGTPEAGNPAPAVVVDISNFAYVPSSITVPAGGTITWTNHDTTAHTVTAQDRTVLQSGTIKPGASYTQTFTTAGTYTYFCEFHAGMKGTVVVQGE